MPFRIAVLFADADAVHRSVLFYSVPNGGPVAMVWGVRHELQSYHHVELTVLTSSHLPSDTETHSIVHLHLASVVTLSKSRTTIVVGSRLSIRPFRGNVHVRACVRCTDIWWCMCHVRPLLSTMILICARHPKLYFWTHSLSSPRWRNLLAWIVGCAS